MPAKEIFEALRDLVSAGWRVQIANGRSHAYARAYCPGTVPAQAMNEAEVRHVHVLVRS